ncbi:esterase/lipase family protein [Pseudarthrobacter sp. S9]|uniref:esterase/lipase family protein n=1 Tax=Pseudarthrobacter sp. S9 TaxID=3418421 RepID=UPI003CFF0AC0
MGQRLPIIYVRGFAGGQNAIDDAVDDPFYGFNEGSTHIRVGAGGQPRFYQFEGPLLRFLKEQDYKLSIAGSQQQALLTATPGELAPDSIWIYRFYDADSGTFGPAPQPYDIGQAAKGLAAFIALVRSKTQDGPPVYLVAHSMGGLICRTVLQRELDDPNGAVSKLCTIGTPHGGIDPQMGGPVGGWIMDKFGPMGSQIFTPDHMQQYMLRDDHELAAGINPRTGQWDPRRMVGEFSPHRVLSIVGTDSTDYAVAQGLSSAVMGVQSDGLVAIRNAYVYGSARAYVHRSHSGRYGLVNSEEMYQNLSRFILGGLRVEVGLHGLNFAEQADRIWQAEVRVAIQGIPVLMHEQTAEHYCPVDLNAESKEISTPVSPVPLVTIFLQPKTQNTCRYALDLKVMSLKEDGGILGFGDHLEQIGDWEDTLIVDVQLGGNGTAQRLTWQWNSTLIGRIADQSELTNPLTWEPDNTGESEWHVVIQVPDAAKTLLGGDARLELLASSWD